MLADEAMNVKTYIKLLKGVEASSKIYVCPYCGSKTYSKTDQFFCSYCEGLIPSGRAVPVESIQQASEINNLVRSSKFDLAFQKYESLADYSINPYFAYAEALAYIELSNYETSQINYTLNGFMEENIVHRNNSIAAFSKARLLLAKSIETAKKEVQGGPETAPYMHAMFLSYVRLGDFKAASSVLEKTKKLGSTLVSEYESMVLENNIGEYDKTTEDSVKLLSADMLSVNAAYYLAYALFKKKREKDALAILNAFPGKDEVPAVGRLANEINNYLGNS